MALDGVPIEAIDPTAVLRSIAADTSAPASARVAAAKALLAGNPAQPEAEDENAKITKRALRVLQGGQR